MANDSDFIIMGITQAKEILAANGDYEQGYTNALMQLQDKLRQDSNVKPAELQKVLTHIQDLIKRCGQCGTWLYSDGSCLTCEIASKQKAKKRGK